MEHRGRVRVRALIALAAAAQIFAALFGVFTSSPASAVQSVPYLINFQGRLTDNSGNVLADGSYNVKFRLFDAASSGTNLWEGDRVFGASDHRITVQSGLFNIQFGDAGQGDPALSPSLFNAQVHPSLYLEVELPTPASAACASNGCAVWTEGAMTPRQPLASATYAFNSDTLDGLDSTAFAQLTANNSFTGANLFAPTTSSTVALTVKATTAGSINALEVFDSGGARQAFFDATGALTLSQAITAPTATNTINNLVINNGALSNISGLTMASGGFLQNGTGTFGTGTGAVSLNGDTTVAAGKNLILPSGAGAFQQTFTTATAAASGQTLAFTNNNTGAAGVTMQGINITPTVNAPTSGTNVLNVINFAAGTALTAAENANGLNFASATGYTNFIKTPTFVLSSAGAITGLASLTVTATGNAVVANSVTTGIALSATALTTGSGLTAGGANTSTGSGVIYSAASNTLSTGSALSVTTGGAAITAAYTGALININVGRTHTAATAITDTGNYLNLTRSLTNTNAGGSFTVTGALANLQSNCTQTAGTCADSSNILNLNQQYATASGTVLNVQGAGTGNLANLDTTSATANGVAIDVQSSGTGQYVLKLTSNNTATNVLFARADGHVGIDNAAPSTALDVNGTTNATAFSVGGTAGSSATCSGGQMLQNPTLINGIITAGTCATPSGAGANTNLSNLATTAINQSLIANADNSLDLGASGTVWKDVFTGNVDAGTTTTTLTIGAAATTTAVTVGRSGLAVSLPGGITTSGSNIDAGAGSVNAGSVKTGSTTRLDSSGNLSNIGTLSSSTSATTGTGATLAATNSGASGANTVKGVGINLTGTDNATGSNTTTGLDFGNVAAHTNNTYTAENFGTGFTNLLTYNGSTVIINGTGQLNGAQLTSGTVANGALANSTIGVTAGTGLTGGSSSIALGGSTSLSVAYGSSSGTAVQGNITLVCPAGSGNLTNAGNTITLGAGGTCNSITMTNAPSFSGQLTLSGSGAAATPILNLTGAPAANATTSLVQLAGAIASGNANTNGGTYLGINLAASGAGSAADFINFQKANTVELKVDNSGNLTAGGAVNGQTIANASSFVTSVAAPTINATSGFSANGTAGVGVSCGAGTVNEAATYIEGILTTAGTCTAVQAAGNYLVQAPAGTANTITAASGAQGLIIKGTNGTGTHLIDIYNTAVSPVIVSDFDQNGALATTAAITAPTSSDTINNLVINNGALSGVTGFTQSSGTYSQTTTTATGTASTYALTLGAASGANTEKGLGINLTGVANATGSNTTTGLDFGNVSAATNNTYTAQNFGTGFTNLLTYNASTTLINGTGQFNGAQLQTGTVANGALANSSISTSLTGLTGSASVSLGGTLTLATAYGSTTNTAVQGSVTLTCPTTSGNLSGSGNTITLGAGGNCGAIAMTNAPSFSGQLTLSGNGGATTPILNFTGTPTNAAATSLVQLAGAIVGGNSATNGGTYFGMNLAGSGAGSAADFINFQKANTVELKVDNSGNLTAAATVTGNLFSGSGSGLTNLNPTNLVQGSGAVTLQSAAASNLAVTSGTTGTTTLDTGTTGQVNIGTDTADAKTIQIGPSATNTNTTTYNIATNTAGTQDINLGSTGSGNATAGTTISIQGGTTAATAVVIGTNGAGGITIDSGTTGGVNLGTGAGAKTVTLGTTNTSATTNIQSGSGGVNIADDNNGEEIDIAGVTTAGTHTVAIGTNAASVDTINIGTTNSTSSVLIQGGSGNITLNTSTGNKIIIGSATADTNQILLQVDSYGAAAGSVADTATCTTTTNQGALYYNSNTNAVRSCVNGAWEDLVTTGGLGILLFGIVPDSGGATGAAPGDYQGITAAGAGPCKVIRGSGANTVRWNGCVAYSSGRKIVVPDQTADFSTGITTTANQFQNLCLSTANTNQPTFVGSGNTTDGSQGEPAFSAGAPVVCLATIKESALGSAIAQIYDTRTFTTSTKQFVNLVTTLSSPGMLVRPPASAGTAGQWVVQNAAAGGRIGGVVVATAGTVIANTINAVIATAGPAFVKASAGTVGDYLQTTAANGITATVTTISANAYANAGVALSSFSATTCTGPGTDVCRGSLFTVLDIK